MSRGHGRVQLALLARVKRLKSGDPNHGVGWFYLADVPGDYRSNHRAPAGLAAEGELALEEAGVGLRRLMVKPKPPTGTSDGSRVDAYELEKGAAVVTYRPSSTPRTRKRVSDDSAALSDEGRPVYRRVERAARRIEAMLPEVHKLAVERRDPGAAEVVERAARLMADYLEGWGRTPG